METKVLVARSWEDVVFSNRNQEYGAYTLRRAYSKRMMLSWGVTTALLAILVLWSQIAPEHIPTIKPPIIIGTVKLIEPPVLPKRELQVRPQPKPKPAQKIQRTNTQPVVVTHQVVEPVEQFVEPVESAIDDAVGTATDTGTGSSDVGIVDVVPAVDAGPRNWAEVMPAYDGGIKELMKFVKRNLRYPSSAKKTGTEGTVYVSFVVNGDGSVSDVTVVKGISAACDAEAKRVIERLPGWVGGKQNGTPVSVRMVLPIVFQLN